MTTCFEKNIGTAFTAIIEPKLLFEHYWFTPSD